MIKNEKSAKLIGTFRKNQRKNNREYLISNTISSLQKGLKRFEAECMTVKGALEDGEWESKGEIGMNSFDFLRA